MDRRRGVTASPGIEITGVVKGYQGLRPLRVAQLRVGPGDAIAIAGVNAAAAEVFVNLVTGAALPDEGDVSVGGRNTRDIATDTDWLASLDRFGIVTARAVLLESMHVAANLALPFTLAIDPLPADVRARVERLADEVELARARLDAPASSLTAAERVRVHLARALGPGPELLLLEHPTATLERADAEAFGATLARAAAARRLGWVALTEDDRFAKAAGARRLKLDGATGALAADTLWRKLLS
jgi:predicted ABC-type transport system involved in lysophospholipase L1 biosynthesis ATPase subunit